MVAEYARLIGLQIMDKTHQDYANAILNALRDGLKNAVLSEYTEKFGGTYWREVERLTNKKFQDKKLDYVRNNLSPDALLDLIKLNARLFERQKRQEPNLIHYIMELTKLRNGNSHLSIENEERLTDQVLADRAFLATRLLEAFDTKESRQAAEVTRRIRELFLSRIEGETEDIQVTQVEQSTAKAEVSTDSEGDQYQGASEVPHSESHTVQELLRQNDTLMKQMQRMQRQQASQLKTATSANAEAMQQLIRHNQNLMQHMQASQLDKRPHDDDSLIKGLIQQNQAMMQVVQAQPYAPAGSPVININSNINPSISNQAINVDTVPADSVERNDAAFVAGALIGFICIMGAAHLYNRKWVRGLLFLSVGTVSYVLLLVTLAALLNTLGLPLMLLFIFHVFIVWQQAKHGARRKSSDSKAKRASA